MLSPSSCSGKQNNLYISRIKLKLFKTVCFSHKNSFIEPVIVKTLIIALYGVYHYNNMV